MLAAANDNVSIRPYRIRVYKMSDGWRVGGFTEDDYAIGTQITCVDFQTALERADALAKDFNCDLEIPW